MAEAIRVKRKDDHLFMMITSFVHELAELFDGKSPVWQPCRLPLELSAIYREDAASAKKISCQNPKIFCVIRLFQEEYVVFSFPWVAGTFSFWLNGSAGRVSRRGLAAGSWGPVRGCLCSCRRE